LQLAPRYARLICLSGAISANLSLVAICTHVQGVWTVYMSRITGGANTALPYRAFRVIQ